MSRSIHIGYQNEKGGPTTAIEIRSPYDLFGCQRPSKEFWALPDWQRLGVTHLSELGHGDPIYFIGWDMLDALAHEIRIIQDNVADIDFHADLKASWLAHLVYCYSLLAMTAPPDSIPALTIG